MRACSRGVLISELAGILDLVTVIIAMKKKFKCEMPYFPYSFSC